VGYRNSNVTLGLPKHNDKFKNLFQLINAVRGRNTVETLICYYEFVEILPNLEVPGFGHIDGPRPKKQAA